MDEINKEEEYEEIYDGWLVSNNFIKRSLAVLGHVVAAQLILGLSLGVVVSIASGILYLIL